MFLRGISFKPSQSRKGKKKGFIVRDFIVGLIGISTSHKPFCEM